jgi:hypothetical protein
MEDIFHRLTDISDPVIISKSSTGQRRCELSNISAFVILINSRLEEMT